MSSYPQWSLVSTGRSTTSTKSRRSTQTVISASTNSYTKCKATPHWESSRSEASSTKEPQPSSWPSIRYALSLSASLQGSSGTVLIRWADPLKMSTICLSPPLAFCWEQSPPWPVELSACMSPPSPTSEPPSVHVYP